MAAANADSGGEATRSDAAEGVAAAPQAQDGPFSEPCTPRGTPLAWRAGSVSRWRQFGAVLRKNFLLQTRSRRLCWGMAGWAGLAVEVAVPVLFFLLMWLPKYFFEPQMLPKRVYDSCPLESACWAGIPMYAGPAADTGLATLLYAPNDTATSALMRNLARAVACPTSPAVSSSSFFGFFRLQRGVPACATPLACFAADECHEEVWAQQLVGFVNESEAVAYSVAHPNTVDAVIVVEGADTLLGGPSPPLPWGHHDSANYAQGRGRGGGSHGGRGGGGAVVPNVTYTLRLNHTETSSNRQVYSLFDLAPDLLQQQSKQNWFMANLQHAIDRAILGAVASSSGNSSGGDNDDPSARLRPALTSLQFRWFPWPKYVIDVAALVNSVVFFNLLLTYAFLAPTRGMVVAIVREKELRLREGMRILGLRDSAYWGSWAITHLSTLALSSALCALAGMYPFQHSSALLLMLLYLLLDGALMAWAYFLSTLFSKSRVAGTAAVVVYCLAMVPGYLMPSVEPYGGMLWIWSCLLPPSTLSLFAHVLTKLEGGGKGVTWSTFTTSATPFWPFSTATVFGALAADIVIYGMLTWYLDKVMPREIGQRLPWYFPLQPSYWRGDAIITKHVKASSNQEQGGSEGDEAAVAVPGAPAVHVLSLTKLYRTTDGTVKRAVDALSLDVYSGAITALLGHNGAGKTTAISMLTGMITPTSGDAFIGGYSINVAMGRIRQNLGICPQFDILWPDVTVREHLKLYAAIKGADKKDAAAMAERAAASVGLTEKLDSLAGELSGGQRRKLSVGIAFMGDPAVVFLDEPTSGMDPYSRRFTWDVIRRHRERCAVVLTTHSMEEADILADRIAIMAEGQLAAMGTSLQLKGQYGEGYTLTVVKSAASRSSSTGSLMAPQAMAAANSDAAQHSTQAIERLVKTHVPAARVVSSTSSEAVFRLPREEAARFAPLLRDLDDQGGALGCSSYGLSVTTLEEVFLNVTAQAVAEQQKAEAVAEADGGDAAVNGGDAAAHEAPPTKRPRTPPPLQPWPMHGVGNGNGAGGTSGGGGIAIRPIPEESRLTGLWLWLHQWWALFCKRALSARRDRLAVITQLLVPVALVLIALAAGGATQHMVEEPRLAISRATALLNRPPAVGAAPGARGAEMDALLAAYHPNATTPIPGTGASGPGPIVTNTTSLAPGCIFCPENLTGTLDGWLLDGWYQGDPLYDGLFVQRPPPMPLQALQDTGDLVLLANETALQGLPASLNSLAGALLRLATNASTASITVVNYPLPLIKTEAAVTISRVAGELLLIVFCVMGVCTLSASFVVFLVRERESRSKEVQCVSGAPVGAFWAATYSWDLVNFAVPLAGFVGCFVWYGIPEFRGPRLGAVVLLVWLTGMASLPLTYCLHFMFKDEMRALQRLSSLYFLVGYLGFLSTWVLDLLYLFQHWSKVGHLADVSKAFLMAFSPHYCLARGLYEISATYKEATGGPNKNPFAWAATGQLFVCLGVQAVAYYLIAVLADTGMVPRAALLAWQRTRGPQLMSSLRRVVRAGLRRLSKFFQPPGHSLRTLPLRSASSAAARVEERVPLLGAEEEEEEEQGAGGSAAAVAAGGGGGGWGGAGGQGENGSLGVAEAGGVSPGEEAEDPDVANERVYVQSVDPHGVHRPVVVAGLSKTYTQGWQLPLVHAVRDLWLATEEGECFGLLGVNGAGKTTAFRMITGEVYPDAGDAYVCGHSIRSARPAARQLLGYCPQFDALPGALTGREVLTMYARLRGVKPAGIAGTVDELLSRLQLEQYANRVCDSYSGGNKRKLAVAVALVGQPPVVLMDEPSTGMDPAARRFLWSTIQSGVMAMGHTVLLTSHSMEECEALCSRIGIMRAGSLQCIGTVQHLKSRFGAGYRLSLRCAPSRRQQVLDFVAGRCPGSVCHPEPDPEHLRFSMPRHAVDLPALFEGIEANRDALGIEDYSLSQTTLEQVFVILAQDASAAPVEEDE